MAPARPRLRERTSAATISLIVAASSDCTKSCPAVCGLPPGRKTLAEVGKRAYRSALLAMVEAEKAEVGKPCSAHSSAADTESVNDRVPQRSSATHQASGEAGTTVRSRPIGMSPACLVRKSSALARRGYGPTPETSKVSPVEARCTRIGATPAKLTMSGWTTPSMNPAATPASIALPPSASTRAAACAASGCPAATIHFRPITCVIGPEPAAAALRWYCAESSVMARMLTYRHGSPLAPHRRQHLDHGRRKSRASLCEFGLPARGPAGRRRAGAAAAAALGGVAPADRRGAPGAPPHRG